MTRYGFRLSLLLLGVGLASGCGEPKFTFYPVEGTVTKGGQPLRNIEVVFLADPETGTIGPRATGRTDKDGRYRLRTDLGDDGAVAGKHRVLVLDLEAAKKQFLVSLREHQLSAENTKRLEDELKTAADASRVPPGYGSINQTPLRVEIGSASQVFNIELP